MSKYYFSIVYFIYDFNHIPDEQFIAKYNNFAITEDFDYIDSNKIMDIVGEEFYKNHIKKELIYEVINKDPHDSKILVNICTPLTEEQVFYCRLKYGDSLNGIIKQNV